MLLLRAIEVAVSGKFGLGMNCCDEKVSNDCFY